MSLVNTDADADIKVYSFFDAHSEFSKECIFVAGSPSGVMKCDQQTSSYKC